MEKQSRFIKEFSKEQSQAERDVLAQKIKARRKEVGTKTEHEARLRVLQQEGQEREAGIGKLLRELEQLGKQIAELSNQMLGKLRSYFEIQKLRADIVVGQRTLEDLHQQQRSTGAEVARVQLQKDESIGAYRGVRGLLSEFYEAQKRKWERSPHTKEEIIKYFNEEHLASLSLEEYALLMRRFPGEMVTHVTRQGVRDHIGHMFHTVDQGKYVSGFTRMLTDGRLRSPLGVSLLEGAKDAAIAKHLQLDHCKTKKEAMDELAALVGDRSQENPGSYVDLAAIHFAAEEVADSYYGSETGNEIFVAYPSALVAAQYYFNGTLTEASGDYWNDQWVWANEERGIDLDAGIVFIPRDAKVDRKTGSRYELTENLLPLVNQEYKDAIERMVNDPDFYYIAAQIKEISGQFTEDMSDPDLFYLAKDETRCRKNWKNCLWVEGFAGFLAYRKSKKS